MSSVMMDRMRAWSSTSVRGASGGGDLFFSFRHLGMKYVQKWQKMILGVVYVSCSFIFICFVYQL